MKLFFEIIIQILAIVLCIYWFDWKLLLVMFLFLFGNNLMRTRNVKIKEDLFSKLK